MKCTRKQTVLLVSGAILLLLGAYGLWRVWPRLTNPYYGLTTSIDVQMDEATRILVQQKIDTAQASLLAAEQAGQKPDDQLYLVIAENQYLLGDLIASRKTYEIILDRNPISYVAWNSYGSLLETMNDLVPAENAYRQAIALMPTEEYYRDYVDFLMTHYPDRRADIKATLDEAYQTLGQTTWTMILLGVWYFNEGDCDQGKSHYLVAKGISPENSEAIQKELNEKFTVCKKQS
ncbi:MAG: hypothetical protein AAB839_02235 [Patescibacteria group bacterium]